MGDKGTYIVNPGSTLGEAVYRLIKSGKGSTEEMGNLIKWFGLEKLEKVYEEEKQKRESSTKGEKDGTE